MRFIRRPKTGHRAIIPRIDACELLDDNLPVVLRFYTFATGSLTPYERLVVNALIRKSDPKRVFEIGTFDGRTTWNMAANTADESVIYTLDLPKEHIDCTDLDIDTLDRRYIDKDESGIEYVGTKEESKISQLFGDTATFDFSPFHDSIDFVFVDGSHSYDYVKHDSDAALRLLRHGKGTILWHDYDRISEWPGCMRALNEIYEGRHECRGLCHILGTSLVILTLD